MSKKEDIKTLKEFLSMPVKSAEPVLEKFASLKCAVKRGEGIASFVYVPGKRSDRVLLVAHADTFWEDEWKREGYNIYMNGQGEGNGSEGRAGCAILWQLRNSGHSLLVINGREHGLRGAHFIADENTDIFEEINNSHQFALEFSFKDHNFFMTYGLGSPKFDNYIENEFGLFSAMQLFYENIKTWRDSDISVLCREICGANISTGTYNMHRSDEYTDEDQWLDTLDKAREMLISKDLPRFLRTDQEEIVKDRVDHYVKRGYSLIFDGAPETEAIVFVTNTVRDYKLPDEVKSVFMNKGFTLLRVMNLFSRAGDFERLALLQGEKLIDESCEKELLEYFEHSVNRIYFAYGDVSSQKAEELVGTRAEELRGKIKLIRPDMEFYRLGELTESGNPKKLEDIKADDEDIRF
jgi:hypothetical protein